MMKNITATDEYKTFEKEIDELSSFTNDFSILLDLNGRIEVFITKNGCFNFDTCLLKSASKTLQSVKQCCAIGSFSDANTLVRKFRDDLIQYLYILSVIKTRKPFIEDDLKDIKIENTEECIKALLNVRLEDTLTDDEKAIEAWLRNLVSNLTKPEKNKLGFKNYFNVLSDNCDIKKILVDYNLEKYWDYLRNTLNDFVHNNGQLFSNQNIFGDLKQNLDVNLKNINYRISFILSFFLIILMMVDPSLISSTDYIDQLECGLDPTENSQYDIAPFVQDFLDQYVVQLHPDLKQYLKENNIYGMKID
jgi:hypothetical protein